MWVPLWCIAVAALVLLTALYLAWQFDRARDCLRFCYIDMSDFVIDTVKGYLGEATEPIAVDHAQELASTIEAEWSQKLRWHRSLLASVDEPMVNASDKSRMP